MDDDRAPLSCGHMSLRPDGSLGMCPVCREALSNVLLDPDEKLRCGMSAMSAEWPTGKGVIKVETSISPLQAVETDASPSEKLVAEAT